MVNGRNNKEISSQLSIPLSTIQRRVRTLLTKGIVTPRVQLNYEKLGFKTGLLHIYLKNGISKKLQKRFMIWMELHHMKFISEILIS